MADLAPGDGGVITVTAVVSPQLALPATIANTATIAGSAPGEPDDSWPEDNAALAVLPVGLRPQLDVSPVAQAVQYSDRVPEVTVTVSGAAGDDLALAASLPKGLTLVQAGCQDNAGSRQCRWTLGGPVDEPRGVYTLTLTATGRYGLQRTLTQQLEVTPEDAQVTLSPTNPQTVPVTRGRQASDPFTLEVQARELSPDAGLLPLPGDVGRTSLTLRLAPAEPESGPALAPLDCQTPVVAGTGYDGSVSLRCRFDAVPLGSYRLLATAGGGYYVGAVEAPLDVVAVEVQPAIWLPLDPATVRRCPRSSE